MLTYTRRKTAVYFCFLLGITGIVYLPGLSGGFYFDDEWNILRNTALKINELSASSLDGAANSGHAGPLGRPIAMLSFGINYYFSGFIPFSFKLTNLLIHLLSGAGVFLLSLGLARRLPSLSEIETKQLALLASAFWLLHPLNLSPVLYVVQRMAGLSALFCFWGLVAYIYGRADLEAGKRRGMLLIISAFAVFLPLGLFSKENAALFPLYCFLIEVIFFRFKTLNQGAKIFLMILYFGVLVLPTISIVGYTLVRSELILGGYAIREFSLAERLLTESRILVFYLKQLVFPVNSELGLFHDDIKISKSILNPLSTLFSIILIFSLILPATLYIKKFSLYSFCILFFFSAHLMESTLIGLELVHEHRNYVASFSILFFLAYWIISLSKKELFEKVKYATAFAAIFYFGFSTYMRASAWGNANIHAFEEVSNHSDSPRSNYQVGRIFASYGHDLGDNKRKKEYLNKASHYFEKTAEISENYTDGLFGLLMLEGIERKKMKGQYYRALLDRLKNAPFKQNNYNYLSSLFSCIDNDVCQIEPARIADIMSACQENPLFVGRHKQNILASYSRYKISASR